MTYICAKNSLAILHTRSHWTYEQVSYDKFLNTNPVRKLPERPTWMCASGTRVLDWGRVHRKRDPCWRSLFSRGVSGEVQGCQRMPMVHVQEAPGLRFVNLRFGWNIFGQFFNLEFLGKSSSKNFRCLYLTILVGLMITLKCTYKTKIVIIIFAPPYILQ
jgi:hypothetical protein